MTPTQILSQIIPGPVVGSSLIKDTTKVNEYLNSADFLKLIPQQFRNIKFLWEAETFDDKEIKTHCYQVKQER